MKLDEIATIQLQAIIDYDLPRTVKRDAQAMRGPLNERILRSTSAEPIQQKVKAILADMHRRRGIDPTGVTIVINNQSTRLAEPERVVNMTPTRNETPAIRETQVQSYQQDLRLAEAEALIQFVARMKKLKSA